MLYLCSYLNSKFGFQVDMLVGTIVLDIYPINIHWDKYRNPQIGYYKLRYGWFNIYYRWFAIGTFNLIIFLYVQLLLIDGYDSRRLILSESCLWHKISSRWLAFQLPLSVAYLFSTAITYLQRSQFYQVIWNLTLYWNFRPVCIDKLYLVSQVYRFQ